MNRFEKAIRKAKGKKRYPRIAGQVVKRSKEVLTKKLQTYKPEIADILPLALPYSVKKQFIEEISEQDDGSLNKSYTFDCEDWSISLLYSFPPFIASQKRVKFYPVLGREALPVFLAMISLAKVQESSRVVFSPGDIGSLIYENKSPSGAHKKIRDIILCMSLAKFTVACKKAGSFAVRHYGSAVFAGRKSIWCCGLKLNPGDIYFHFDEDWLIPSSLRYFKTQTLHLKKIGRLPRYMQNGYLWLARNQNTIQHLMNPPYIETFLKSGFKWTDKAIEAHKGKGEVRKKLKAFAEEMKKIGVLEDAEITGGTAPSDLSTNKVKFVLTKEFENLKVDHLTLTPELKEEVWRWLYFRENYETSAKNIMEIYKLKPKSEEMTKHIESGAFDKLVERGYYTKLEKDLPEGFN